MALARVTGAVVAGVAGALVQVEVDISDGLPSVGLVGLPDTTVGEARLRARCAVASVGGQWPNRRITISLTPAEVRKNGAGLDLPMAIAVLAAAQQVPQDRLGGTVFTGELGLDGRLRSARGALPGALAARAAGMPILVAPRDAGPELTRLTGIRILLADGLKDVLDWLCDPDHPGLDGPAADAPQPASARGPDLSDVRGHSYGRLALEVAAAGGHHLAFVGPPGVGKTLLAERLPGLLDDLGDEQALEVACLHSVAGLARADDLYRRPPAQAPHHSASGAAVLGAVRGARVAPGAVTLAHHGVLILDEAPEFARPALEGLRQSLESGTIGLDRAGWSGRLPARFQLVITANPCPCGQRVGRGVGCSCSPAAVRRYAARLSGPLVDRIDLRLSVSRPPDAELGSSAPAEATADVRARVAAARERGRHRLRGRPWSTNASVPTGELRRHWLPDIGGQEMLHEIERRSANLRGPDRVLRVAWTLSDLAGRDRPGRDEIAAAAGLRGASLGWAA